MRARRRNAGGLLPWERGYLRKLRVKVIELLGGYVCRECGCSIEAILEINHRNGGGRKQTATMPLRRKMYLNILNGKVKKEDYEVLCRICNAAHYVREILGIKGHQVTWNLTY
jgi:hypothetical protein